jgi:hypothetical protein
MRLNITENLNVGFDPARTLTRPDFNFLTPVLDVSSRSTARSAAVSS